MEGGWAEGESKVNVSLPYLTFPSFVEARSDFWRTEACRVTCGPICIVIGPTELNPGTVDTDPVVVDQRFYEHLSHIYQCQRHRSGMQQTDRHQHCLRLE